MYAQVVTFQDNPADLEAGVEHVKEEVIPAFKGSGVSGPRLVDPKIGKSRAYASQQVLPGWAGTPRFSVAPPARSIAWIVRSSGSVELTPAARMSPTPWSRKAVSASAIASTSSGR